MEKTDIKIDEIKNLLSIQVTSCGDNVGCLVTSDLLTSKEKRELIQRVMFWFNDFINNGSPDFINKKD